MTAVLGFTHQVRENRDWMGRAQPSCQVNATGFVLNANGEKLASDRERMAIIIIAADKQDGMTPGQLLW
jgi:hypothetical protein